MADEQLVKERTIQLVKSKTVVHSIEEAAEVIESEGIVPATIPEVVMDARFLHDNQFETFIVSSRGALDSGNKMLENDYYKIDREKRKILRSNLKEEEYLNWNDKILVRGTASDVIRRTMEDGEERLLALDAGFWGRGRLEVDSSIWIHERGAHAVGKKQIGVEALGSLAFREAVRETEVGSLPETTDTTLALSALKAREDLAELLRRSKSLASRRLPQAETVIQDWIKRKQRSLLFRIFDVKDAYETPQITNVRIGGCIVAEVKSKQEKDSLSEGTTVYNTKFYTQAEIEREIESIRLSMREKKEFDQRDERMWYIFDIAGTQKSRNYRHHGPIKWVDDGTGRPDVGGHNDYVKYGICNAMFYTFYSERGKCVVCSPNILEMEDKQKIAKICQHIVDEGGIEFEFFNPSGKEDRIIGPEDLTVIGIHSNEAQPLLQTLNVAVADLASKLRKRGILFETRKFKLVPVVSAMLSTKRRDVKFSIIGFAPNKIVKTKEFYKQ